MSAPQDWPRCAETDSRRWMRGRRRELWSRAPWCSRDATSSSTSMPMPARCASRSSVVADSRSHPSPGRIASPAGGFHAAGRPLAGRGRPLPARGRASSIPLSPPARKPLLLLGQPRFHRCQPRIRRGRRPRLHGIHRHGRQGEFPLRRLSTLQRGRGFGLQAEVLSSLWLDRRRPGGHRYDASFPGAVTYPIRAIRSASM